MGTAQRTQAAAGGQKLTHKKTIQMVLRNTSSEWQQPGPVHSHGWTSALTQPLGQVSLCSALPTPLSTGSVSAHTHGPRT